MYEIKLKVTKKWLEKADRYQSMYSGVSLTPEQMLEIFKTEANEILLKQSLIFAFETGEREAFHSLMAKHLIGLDWPMNCESHKEEYKNFIPRLLKVAKEKGYKVI